MADNIFNEVKERVSFESIARDHGMQFNRNGKAICPFHDDHNPSLSLHPSKAYANCFVCNKAIDAIELEYLLGAHGNRWEAAKALNDRYGLNLKFNNQDKEKAKKFEDAFSLLNWFCEETHKELLKNTEALEWLEKKKRITIDVVRENKIGYVDNGWLRDKVTDKSKEIALNLGLLKEKDGRIYDTFWNRFIFPVWNYDKVVGIWTREFPDKENSNYKWVGLSSSEFIPSKPIAFIENLYCDICVVTESIPDALAFLKVDIPAVALLGKAVSRENQIHFQKAKAKLIFALDPDEEGRRANYELSKAFKGYVLNLGYDKDPDEILAELGKDEFKKVAEKAIDVGEYYLDLVIEREDKIEALREIAKLELESDKDIWLNRLKEKHGVTIGSLRVDLNAIKAKDELKKASKDEILENQNPLHGYAEDEIKKATELLDSKNILDKVVEITNKAGYVKEERNKKLTYLAATSRKLPGKKKAISLITKGESSSGKSELVKIILKLIPPKDVKEFTFITEKALVHAKHDLSHKILCVFEREGGEKSNYSIRTAISEEKLSIFIPAKDPTTGNFESIEKEVPAEGMVYIETTTAENTEPQNASRTFEFFTDSSPELTREVLRSQARTHIQNESKLESEYRIWRCLQDLLKPLPVYAPYAKELAEQFPTDKVRARRDFLRLLALIEVSAFLYQKNRDRKEIDGEMFIVASENDFNVALEIIKPILEQTYKDLSPKEESLIKIIKEEFGFGYFVNLDDSVFGGENVFGPREFSEKIKPRLKSNDSRDKIVREFKAYSTIRRYFKNLSEKGILEWNGKTGAGSKYVLISDISHTPLHISLSSWANPPKNDKLSNNKEDLQSKKLAQSEMSQLLANEPIDDGLAQKKDISSPLAQSEMSSLFEDNSPKSLENADISSLAHENIRGNIEKIGNTVFKVDIKDENGKPIINIITSNSPDFEEIKNIYEQQQSK